MTGVVQIDAMHPKKEYKMGSVYLMTSVRTDLESLDCFNNLVNVWWCEMQWLITDLAKEGVNAWGDSVLFLNALHLFLCCGSPDILCDDIEPCLLSQQCSRFDAMWPGARQLRNLRRIFDEVN
jgi:hypothetical protein